jgi:phenylacetate-coenzyme A ligase PaaK-like adenylate-forming protein
VQAIVNNIFSVNDQNFTATALTIFKYQYLNNEVYRKWVDLLHVNVDDVKALNNIPFLPIQLFKTHKIATGEYNEQTVFESSGTTASGNSRHFVKDVYLYEKSFTKGFEMFYGNSNEWCIVGLLPSYLERNNSSLVMMVDRLIKQSNHPFSGFYLDNFKKLSQTLLSLEKQGQKTLLIGVTFALLDFAEQFPMKLSHTYIMETGGMKGRRKEMVREEVHSILKKQFEVETIHSEYGMTELLSQAYAQQDGFFTPVPWMKVLIRDDEDPLNISATGRGGLNIIDLANIYSCSFIAAEDIGAVYPDGKFTVSGRIDASDVRGCSLMYTMGT